VRLDVLKLFGHGPGAMLRPTATQRKTLELSDRAGGRPRRRAASRQIGLQWPKRMSTRSISRRRSRSA